MKTDILLSPSLFHALSRFSRANSTLHALCLCGLFIFFSLTAFAQVPTPKDILGFTPGDDRKLASWAQTLEYFHALDKASDRMIFQEIGNTTMGVPFVYATISSPENLKDLEKYKQINAKLADPRTLGTQAPSPARGDSREKAAQRLIKQGKTIVMITCGIHSDEVGSELSSMLIAYKLLSSNDPETLNILKNTIILLVPSLNPDGVDIVKNWYDKTLGTPYEGTDPPELYNKYVGHDDNRDWYAFTQIETQLTVDKIHNVWHPQIVHDIHQQGEFGSRLFLPPYMQPVEPNVPKQIVEGYTELGNYMAADLRKQGFQGITTDSTYDAWTPSRAYSHYHGGVRILSETASCKLATPITVKFDQLRPGLGYDPKKEAPNFGPVWRGGEWHLRDITNYMTTAAFSLLNHASDNRERWLTRFYEIGKEAVRPRNAGETWAYLIKKRGDGNAGAVISDLKRGGLEVVEAKRFRYGGAVFEEGSAVVRLDQPYAAFATALLEPQLYPDLRDEKGQPFAPYDVTAHSMALLTNTPVVKADKPFAVSSAGPPLFTIKQGAYDKNPPDAYLFRSSVPSMDEGWTRWVFNNYDYVWETDPSNDFKHRPVTDSEIRSSGWFEGKTQTIIFPDQSPNQILNGYAKGSMPDEYTGGVGREGVENLKKFVEAGGTLVFLNRASDFAIEQFNLPIKDITKDLPRKDFYIPGSILRTELDLTHPIAKGMPKESIAWFERSPAFEVGVTPSGVNPAGDPSNAAPSPENKQASDSGTLVTPEGVTLTYRIIARYPSDPKQILLSGWAVGAEKIAGKAALVELTIGKGKLILFGFRPQYRGQSLATFPLFFNAISN